jgi:hypothetical protein
MQDSLQNFELAIVQSRACSHLLVKLDAVRMDKLRSSRCDAHATTNIPIFGCNHAVLSS